MPTLSAVMSEQGDTDCAFTPLNNYNGTPFGRLNRDLRATLPIDQLKGKPQVAVCPILNVHRCKLRNGV